MPQPYRIHCLAPRAPLRIDYEAELNAEQLAAVTAPPGKTLVIAGAGSGKTRTLTYRVAWLLEHGVPACSILLLTFTNKAAREMTERVCALLETEPRDLWAGTFHSICNRILRHHAAELGFTPSFSIIDRDDQKSLLAAAIAQEGIDTKNRRFPKSEVILSIISLAANSACQLSQVLAERYAYFLEYGNELEAIQRAFSARKASANCMDFDDLLVLCVELLRTSDNARSRWQGRFSHILVDEYQDTNALQNELLELLVGPKSQLMVVGDDAQAIYSWRGAEVDHILEFPARHAGAHVYTIQANYRSIPEILAVSNAAIRANRKRYEKNLQAMRPACGQRPVLLPLPDPATQAAFVCQRIEELFAAGIEPKDIAVLYRAHYLSLEIQLELTRRSIPFAITSGLRFFEQAHVKDVAAFMRFACNRRDEISFKRIVGLLPSCGPATCDKLWRRWRDSPAASAELAPLDWYAELSTYPVPHKAQEAWKQFAYLFNELTIDGQPVAPAAMIRSVIEGFYDDYLRASYDNYEARRSDLEQLGAFAGTCATAEEFLTQLSLLDAVDDRPNEGTEGVGSGRVTLTSIHQAKGLEWKVVFLVWLADHYFPNGRVLEEGDLDAFEEERRLFYVALTRACDELYLSYPMYHPRAYSGNPLCRPSRFLEDIPSELIELWSLEESGFEQDPSII